MLRDDQPSPDKSGSYADTKTHPPIDDQHFGFQQALLPLDADLVRQDVAAIAQQLWVVHA